MITDLVWLKKAGRCRSGGDGRGSVVHLVPNGKAGDQDIALCGAWPRLFWSDDITPLDTRCPKCLKLRAP